MTNQSSYALARALQIPLVGTEVRPEPAILPSPLTAPITGNFQQPEVSGTFTAGLLQYDVIAEGVTATHDNMPLSEVGVAGWLPFLRTHFNNGVATLDDPFVSVGLAHGTAP